MSKKEMIEDCLRRFASMHLVCIEKQETEDEKVTRRYLEDLGYIEIARKALGGKYERI